MVKKIVSILLCVVIAALTFSACSHDEELNIIYPISADPECVDPQIAENDTALIVAKNCMEGLVRLDGDGKIQPGAAESWSVSDDGMTYTFNLRQDAKWQMLKAHKVFLGEDCLETFDNRVKADDFVFGITRALRAETKAKYAYLLYCINGAEKLNAGQMNEKELGIFAVDDYTIKINLNRKNDDFLRILTMPMCMPCCREFFEATKAKYGLELKYTLFNGPFYIGKWASDSSLTLFKSEVYKGDAAVKTNAIYLYINTDEDLYLSKFRQGDYNVVSLTDSGLSKVENNKENSFFDIYNRTYGFSFNCADPLISNDNLRKALVTATDLSALGTSENNIAGGIIPDSCRFGDKSFRETAGTAFVPKPDKNKAVEYYEKALEELDSGNISLSVVCPEEYRTDVIRILQNWEKIFGLSMSVSASALSKEELDKSLADKSYQIAFNCIEADSSDPLVFLKYFCEENDRNIWSYSDKDYQDIIDYCVKNASGDSYYKKMIEAENTLISNGVFYPVYKAKTSFGYLNELEGVFCSENNRVIDFTLRGIK